MEGPARVKICGISTLVALQAALDHHAGYIGFVFFRRSPRNVTPDAAASLAAYVPAGVVKVGLIVDASDAEIDEILARVPLDMLQLHGSETPERVLQIKDRYGLPVMKAVGVAEPRDLGEIDRYVGVADQLLIDAKPPVGAVLPGGNGLAFDWAMLAARRWACPWMLAGGLTAANVAEAMRRTGALQVDVSSGVESAPGVKDPERIAAFLRAARDEQSNSARTFV